jgi:hypothetical protein
MGRIESAMQAIRSLRPDSFTVAELDDELQAMAMIRALPAEYQAFRSSLMLLDKIDKRTLQEAFKNEEIQRLQAENASPASPARALAASTSGARQNTLRPRTLYNCDFCGRVGHTMDRCKQFAAAQGKQDGEPRDRGWVAGLGSLQSKLLQLRSLQGMQVFAPLTLWQGLTWNGLQTQVPQLT